jgi:hypothetical protein
LAVFCASNIQHSLFSQLTGLITSAIAWDEVLENIFADETSGVDCVLGTETLVYTYHIRNGVATFM